MRKLMKIAFYNLTTTTLNGGIETFNWEMGNQLALKGHTVHLFGGHGDIRAELPDTASVLTYPYIKRDRFPDLGSRFRKFMERLSFAFYSFNDLRKGDYDYIYLSKPYDIPCALAAGRLSRARVVYGSGGTEFFPGYRALAKRLDLFLACSKHNAGQIQDFCGLKPFVLNNGVNVNIFSPKKINNDLAAKLGINEQDKVLISACRLVSLKGLDYSIKAVSELKGKGHNIKYIIIGAGDHKAVLEKQAADLNLSGSVIFTGNVPNSDIPNYYSIADLAVFPSVKEEAFGIAIAEAMACEVPVVASNLGGIPEVVGPGCGSLVQIKDSQAIAQAAEEIISDETLAKKMGVAAREYVVENFSWEKIAGRFEELAKENAPIKKTD